jgi:exopolysaccharide biosynthesis polyprenyl glycosylphosphotransferase
MASITRQTSEEHEPLDDDRRIPALNNDIQIIPDASDDGSLIPMPVEQLNAAPAPSGRMDSNALRRRLVAGDVVALGSAWGALAFTRRANGLGHEVALAAIAVLVTLLAMERGGLYRSRVCALRSLEVVRVVTACAIGTAAFLVGEAFGKPVDFLGPIVTGIVAAVVVLGLRWRFSRWLRARRSTSKFLRTVVMVGTNEDAEELWTLLNDEPELGYRVGGVVGEPRLDAPWGDLPRCEDIEGLGELARRTGANGVIVVASALVSSPRKQAVDVALAANLHVQVWPGLYGLSSRRARMAPISGVPILYVEPKKVSTWQRFTKRGMDLVLGTALVVLTAPLVGLAALAIKLTDHGPVIYRSQRAGRLGSPILVLKLRTMVQDASKMMVNISDLNERTGGPLFKATDDPRVTRVGRILRATSIDELPQLWNVLNGTMSLVGPRPALLDEVEHFDPELRRRHDMRPGITGLWQVEARDNPSFSAYRRLDLSYIDNWSLGLDIAILASTVHELAVRGIKTFAHAATDRDEADANSPAAATQHGVAKELGSETA